MEAVKHSRFVSRFWVMTLWHVPLTRVLHWFGVLKKIMICDLISAVRRYDNRFTEGRQLGTVMIVWGRTRLKNLHTDLKSGVQMLMYHVLKKHIYQCIREQPKNQHRWKCNWYERESWKKWCKTGPKLDRKYCILLASETMKTREITEKNMSNHYVISLSELATKLSSRASLSSPEWRV